LDVAPGALAPSLTQIDWGYETGQKNMVYLKFTYSDGTSQEIKG